MAARIRRTAVLSALSVVAITLGAPRSAMADGELRQESVTIYRINPDSGVVNVTATYTIKALKENSRRGNVITSYFFTGFRTGIPATALSVKATENGRDLTLTVDAKEGRDFFIVDVDLARNLDYRETQVITMTYDLIGRPPRTKDDPSRVNGAYAAFPVWATGDPGLTSVRIVIPPGFDIETDGETFVQSEAFGEAVYAADNIAEPESFYAFAFARNDSKLDTTKVKVGDNSFEIRSWPFDNEWSAFAKDHLTKGVPQLEQLTGIPWPEPDITTVVREAYTPYLYGYGGWYDDNRDEIEIGEDLDDELVYHELSHAWFNDDLVEDRWLHEGLAQEYASRVAAKVGKKLSAPEKVAVTDPGAFKLADWKSHDDELSDADRFGYDASWWVLRQLYDEIGEDGMRNVLVALDSRTPAYASDTISQETTVARDNRRVLDLLENVGGSKKASQLLRAFVFDKREFTQLDKRDAARKAFTEFEARQNGWATPAGLLEAMERWQFDGAQEVMTDADKVLAARGEVESAFEPLKVEPPTDLRDGYARLNHIVEPELDADELVQRAEDHVAAAKTAATTVAAVAAPRDIPTERGLEGSTIDADVAKMKAALSAGDDEAVAELASSVSSALRAAPAKGAAIIKAERDAAALRKRNRILMAGGAGLALVMVGSGFGVRRRRVRRNEAARNEAARNEAARNEADRLNHDWHVPSPPTLDSQVAMPAPLAAAPEEVVPDSELDRIVEQSPATD